MANKVRKTAHNGAKGSAASSGHWGVRAEAKSGSKKRRRQNDGAAIAEQSKDI